MEIKREIPSVYDAINKVNLSEVKKSAFKAEFRQAELIKDIFLRVLVPAGAITLIVLGAHLL